LVAEICCTYKVNSLNRNIASPSTLGRYDPASPQRLYKQLTLLLLLLLPPLLLLLLLLSGSKALTPALQAPQSLLPCIPETAA
jgi:hypothetical protein